MQLRMRKHLNCLGIVVMLKVLVVDDEKVLADSLVRILTLSNYEASAVDRGEDAVKAAMRLKPDVVLIDVVMGMMSGIVAAIMIRRSLPECRVVLLSGQPETGPGDFVGEETLAAVTGLRLAIATAITACPALTISRV
jgi:CheY-like chemotaxis protein